jgi:hypothetical protein
MSELIIQNGIEPCGVTFDFGLIGQGILRRSIGRLSCGGFGDNAEAKRFQRHAPDLQMGRDVPTRLANTLCSRIMFGN